MEAGTEQLFESLVESARQGLLKLNSITDVVKGIQSTIDNILGKQLKDAESKLTDQITAREKELTVKFSSAVAEAVSDASKVKEQVLSAGHLKTRAEIEAILTHYSQLFIDQIKLIETSPGLLGNSANAFLDQWVTISAEVGERIKTIIQSDLSSLDRVRAQISELDGYVRPQMAQIEIVRLRDGFQDFPICTCRDTRNCGSMLKLHCSPLPYPL